MQKEIKVQEFNKHIIIKGLLSLILIAFVNLLMGNNFEKDKQALKELSSSHKIMTNKIVSATPGDTIFMSKREYKSKFYEATNLFFENHFALALPIFLEMLKVNVDNAHINFYVGACYMNISESKQTAIPYLQKAVKNTTIWYDYDYRSTAAPVFAYFYLAAVYRNNYKFSDAVINNKIFKSFVSQENEDLLAEVDREIQTIEGGNYIVEQPEFTHYYGNLLTERIQYDMYIRNPEQDANWWINNLEGMKREALVNGLINLAYSGQVNVYDEENRLLTNEQVLAIGNEPTLLKTQTPNPPYNDTIILVENQLNRQLITKLRFLEEWYIDQQTLQIAKKVVGLSPLIEEYFEDNTFKGFKTLFNIYYDDKYPYVLLNKQAQKTKILPADTLLSQDTTLQAENMIYDSLSNKFINLNVTPDFNLAVKAQTTLTERIRYDVIIRTERTDNDWWVENIDYYKRESFIKQLFDLVGNGLIQAYDIFDDSLSIQKVREAIGFSSDTIITKSPSPPFNDTIMVVTVNKIDIDKISKIRFLEEWYLDEKTVQLNKRIIGLAPLNEIYDDNNVFKGYTTLFWVYFDPKYPMKVSQKIVNFKY
ncbi:MAG: hypothetical protein KA792_04165 [Bacteroidales bacterium]|nr:hypothetical protein [Bacteroidales bacterium]